jgi:hypothetical protein
MSHGVSARRLNVPRGHERGPGDPMTPIECQGDILPAHLVRFERFAACLPFVIHM